MAAAARYGLWRVCYTLMPDWISAPDSFVLPDRAGNNVALMGFYIERARAASSAHVCRDVCYIPRKASAPVWSEWWCEDSMASSAESAPDTVHNFSCLQDVEHLQCYQRSGPDNISRLICSAGAESDSRAALMHTVLVALTFVIVPLAVVLNLAVVLTILLNRKLHTIINVLVTVLGINNLVWTGLPVTMVIQAKVIMPVLCSMRAMLFIITRGVSFTVIVTITVLRYLIVVRNHSYPAGSRNVLAFVSIAVLPAVIKWLVLRSHKASACNPLVAQNPDGLLIPAKLENAFDPLIVIIAIVEYGGGILILAFCYIGILNTTVRSRQRVKGNDYLHGGGFRQTASDTGQPNQLDNDKQKKSCAFCSSSGCCRPDERQENRENFSLSAPGPSRSTRPTVSRKMSSVQETSFAGHGNHPTFHSDSRNVNSNCDLLPAVEEVTTRRHALSRFIRNADLSGSNPMNPSIRLTAVQSLAVESRHPSAARSESSHRSPSSSEQKPQDSEGVILQPSNLLSIETPGQSTSCQPAPTLLPRHRSRRGTVRLLPGRVDVVATFSMTAFMIILFVITFQYVVSVALINSRAVCVLTADSRLLVFISISSSMGLGAVVSPIVLVLFSADFRKAFWSTCDRVLRRFRRMPQ